MKDGDTKQRLLTAALELFTGKGFAGASTREIVERAGVTKPALYYHFSSKENLYRVLIEEDFVRFNRALEEIAARPGTPREKLTRVAAYNLEHCRQRPQEFKLTLMALYRGDTFAPEVDILTPARTSIEIISGIFREGIASGTFRKVDPLKMGLFLMSVLHGQMMVIIKKAEGMPVARPEEIVKIFLEGLAVE